MKTGKLEREQPRIGSQRGTIWLAVLTVLLLASPAGAQNTRRVLVLYPESDSRPTNSLVEQSLRSAFKEFSADPVELYNEYLDASRFPDEGHQRNLAKFLRQKYAAKQIDVIIPILSPALDFLLKFRGEVFPGVPIVFCVVDQREVKARTLGPGVVGVPITMDLIPTLELALKLHPNTRRVVVVAGTAVFDAFWEAEARKAFRDYEGKVEIVYLTGVPMEELLKEVATLPPASLIYYLHTFRDRNGTALVPSEIVGTLSDAANAPVYSHFDSYLGRGIVGGRLISIDTEGRNAACLACRIMAGEKPQDIPFPETSESVYLFDWRQLRRWGISEEDLPPVSVVRYKAPGFWDLYKWHIVAVVSVCIAEALLIVGLLVQRMYRRRAEGRFRQVVYAAPNGMIMVGRDGRIVLANAQMEKLFGYRNEELLGQPVELLIPERFREQHPAHRGRFFASPEARLIGVGRDLFGRRKDGSEFPVEIGLNPIQTDAGPSVLASIIDITERRRAEEGLRESQRDLRALTGRLLQAQEAERRRIARELHDDLNQGLALLSVEMDLLAQRPPASAAEQGERMQELSAQVRLLSSTVHDLSHQLHPAKLEQIGLVEAVRGLCQELSHGHGLPIEFREDHVPAATPEETALCLYRIAQEALRNVIKHSGARHATVELLGTEVEICLLVKDDGTGFEVRSPQSNGGLGLVSMRERLRLVGGEIAIDSRPTAGTRIEVRVPYQANDLPVNASQAHG